MKKYIVAILLVIPLMTFAHGDTGGGMITADTSFLQSITDELNKPGITTQSEPTQGTVANRALINKLKFRQKELVELAKQSPAAALRYVIPAKKRVQQTIEAQKYIEQSNTLTGTLEVLHIDDFEHPENSSYAYAVNNEGIKTNIYTAKEINSRSGTKVSLQGYKLNATEFLTDGNSIVLGTMPDIGAIGKQRTLVLLVNSIAQPEQPLTPKQAEDYINNGQFQKFIKEASYGQTWFEAKAYGYIKMPYTDERSACGFANLYSSEITDFFSRNGINLVNFDRVVFLSPGGGGCSSVGKHQMDGANLSEAWAGLVNYNSPSGWGKHSFSWSNLDFLLAHELGHSLGLLHANGFDCGLATVTGECDHVEYGNNYDAMGSGGVFSLNYNGFYKEILGWIKSSNILTINTSGKYTINPLQASGSNMKLFAKIYNPNLSTTQAQYVIENRNAVGFDKDIDLSDAVSSQTKNSGVLVARVVSNEFNMMTRLIDTKPSTKEWYEDIKDAGIRVAEPPFEDKGKGITIGPVLSQNATSTILNITVGTPVCIRSKPSIQTTAAPRFVSKGGEGYSIYFIVRNNDTGGICPPSRLQIISNIPNDWIKINDSTLSKVVKADSTDGLELSLTIPTNTLAKEYRISSTIKNLDSGLESSSKESLIAVLEPPAITTIKPNPAKSGQQVIIEGTNLTHESQEEVSIRLVNVNRGIFEFIKPQTFSNSSITFTLPVNILLPDDTYKVSVSKYGATATVDLKVGDVIPPPVIATSTIRNVKIKDSSSSSVVYKYENRVITWEGTNLSKVNIDLYDVTGLHNIYSIEKNYSVPFSKENKSFVYNWFVSGFTLKKDEAYIIRITDALNKKVQGFASRISIENYQTPTVGTAQVVGNPTINLINAPDGRESALVGNFEIKVNAVSGDLYLPVLYGLFAQANRIAPPDNPNESSGRSAVVKIESSTGDFELTKNTKGFDTYKISKGKSATFKVSASFKPEEMFAGQYVIVLQNINSQSAQDKEVIVKFVPPQTPAITIIGEKAPYITSVNNPVKVNLPVIIEGVRFSPTENILLTNGQKYTLKGAIDNKITFIPSEIGITPGQYNFQIDSPYGKSNYEWLDIKESSNAANILSALWDLFINTLGL